ncbi:MAG: RNA polymerase sigma factor [Pirellulales bacterium]
MEPCDDSDEGLMRQVGEGKPEAVTALLRRYAGPLLTFIQRTVGHRQRAEDLFQEIFLAVWVWRRRYEYPRRFRPWLFGIALNKCRADMRRRSEMPRPMDDCPAASDADSAEAAISSETAAMVVEAVGLLPPAQRAVVTMRVWNGMSYAEIAEAMHRSKVTVRSHMFHGLAALRRHLEPRMR